MSTTSSRPSIRKRTPSKASPVAASVTLNAEGLPSLTPSIEQRTASRQVLHRHLSQGSTAGSALQERRRSSSSASSLLIGAESSSARPTELPRRGSSNLTSPSTSTAASPLGTPTPSPRPRKTSTASVPSTSGPPPRSHSWYGGPSARKSSRAVPQLETIEGSIADLSAGQSRATTDEQEVTTLEAPKQSTADHQPQAEVVQKDDDVRQPQGPDSDGMKRPMLDPGDDKKGKRRSWFGLGVKDSSPATIAPADPNASHSQVPGPPPAGTPNQINMIVDIDTPQATPQAQGSTAPESQSVPIPTEAPKLEAGKPAQSVDGWLAYLSYSRAPAASQALGLPPDADSAKKRQPTESERNDHDASPLTSSPSTLEEGSVRPVSVPMVPAASNSTSRQSSYFNLRRFAAGELELPAAKDASKGKAAEGTTQPSLPVSATKPGEATGGEIVSPSASIAGTSTSKATSKDPLHGGAEHSQKGSPSGSKVAPPMAAAESSGMQTTRSASSWWPWQTQAEIANADITTSIVNDQSTPATPLPALTPALVSSSTDGEDAATIRETRASTVSASSEKTVTSTAANASWSAWFGSYISNPVNSTSVTYAVGMVPSTSEQTASSSAAPSIASAPDADESFPEPPTADPDDTITLQPRNPLLDAIPLSSWTSYFTSKTAYPHKRIEPVADEPEVMEVDFGTDVAGPSSPTYKPATMFDVNSTIRAPLLEKAKPGHGKAGSDVSTSSSATPKVAKPLTTDKKASKGSTSSAEDKKASKPARPNLVLPSFEDTFNAPPRSLPPPPPPQRSSIKRAVSSLSFMFTGTDAPGSPEIGQYGKVRQRDGLSPKVERLPKALSTMGRLPQLRSVNKVAIIGVHGWFMQSYLKNVVGEPTGTSIKFATMMKAAVKAYFEEKGDPLNDEAITMIPLEGDGTVEDRLHKLYVNLTKRADWVEALLAADRVFIASHSQGTIVSAMLIDRLLKEGKLQGDKIAMLSMCSLSCGPFLSLYNSWTVPAYLYFETAAARELFEFQKPDSPVSKMYLECMQNILEHGVKTLFVASLNDQVVPLYSALFSSLSHPSVLRAIFIDAQAFEQADFITNLVVFSTRLRNAGLSSHGLDFHLSDALAGSLIGVGHSSVYDDQQVYRYAIRYLLETTGVLHPPGDRRRSNPLPAPVIEMEDFDPRTPANPFYLPWALRGILEDSQIRALFSEELSELREQFERWNPKTKPLQQVKQALEPLRAVPRRPRKVEAIAEAAEATKRAGAKL